MNGDYINSCWPKKFRLSLKTNTKTNEIILINYDLFNFGSKIIQKMIEIKRNKLIQKEISA